MLIADHRELGREGSRFSFGRRRGELSGGSEEKGMLVSPGGWGGFPRVGDGGRSGWGHQWRGSHKAKEGGGSCVSHTEGTARVTRAECKWEGEGTRFGRTTQEGQATRWKQSQLAALPQPFPTHLLCTPPITV